MTLEYEIAALPGYSSYHSRVLTRRMLGQHPDWVVFYVGGHNDHSRARYYPDGVLPARLARRHAAWHDVRTLLLLENASDQGYRHLVRKLRTSAAQARVPPRVFAENVREMVRAAAAAGAVPLLLSPPFSELLVADHPIVPRYQEALREVAREPVVRFLDLQPLFRSGEAGELHFPDGFHLTAAGHALAAQEIARAILEKPSVTEMLDRDP